MNKLTIYQVDAFTDQVFGGNPAAVCVLSNWLSDNLMQNIAAENNLAETAFVVKDGHQFLIRWFTPTTEVDLCGHATLAAAFVLEKYFHPEISQLEFYSHRSGILPVHYQNGVFTLDFPTDVLVEIECPQPLTQIFGSSIIQCLKGKTDYLLIFKNQEEVALADPNFNELAKVNCRGVIISAPGEEVDFVSRFFAPQVGVNEDPVTGSAHTTLIPYWSKQLGKKKLTAQQISKRGGSLWVEDMGERVKISGKAVLYLEGTIFY
ncbi:PhzF family phenazine biosynthesis protein [Pedobacter cryophilus]|uniref:PhzF family phenazine biosynthesis protein n=1 Tax=Pedobacter cryophilus TaxID=2571271 RepID=A0A4U1BYD6_9SPHI|nr:PhzF family phenazine biosynthesis protein [Pedobacter cryophilus]TKB95156.1 PhzF family phenazine biosynthesis protein [Pedobacter cryophilus]